ncbi:hypothetical protein PGB90_001930 [Kerria lacca]
MENTKNKIFVILFMLVLISSTYSVSGNPITLLDACIQNCAQCQDTLDVYFNGKLCADTCIKFKGKTIPDCESFESISPFLVKIA